MLDDKNAGGSDKSDSSTDKVATKIAIDEILAENAALKERISDLTNLNKTLKVKLDEAEELISDQLRAQMGNELRKISSYDIEDIDAMSLEEIQERLNTLRHAKAVSYKSIRFAPAESRAGNKLWTVGDLTLNAPWRRMREDR